MPIPYAEPGASYAPVVRLAIAHAAGANAAAAAAAAVAAANQVNAFSNSNAAPVVLTGAFAIIALLNFPLLKPTQKVVLVGSVAADVTSAALSGRLVIELVDSVSGALVTPVVQSYPTDGTGVSASYTWMLVPTLAAHTLSVQAKAIGDGSLSVGTGRGTIVAMVIGA